MGPGVRRDDLKKCSATAVWCFKSGNWFVSPKSISTLLRGLEQIGDEIGAVAVVAIPA
jgi:hypothetical protein